MRFNKNLLTATLLTVAGLTAVSSANAAPDTTTTSNLNVEMTVEKTCTVTTGTSIDLTAKAGIVPAVGTGAISVLCSRTTPYTISMLPSGASTAGVGTMVSATAGDAEGNDDTIAYLLTSDSAGATAWTDDSVGASGLGTATAIPHNVYAKVTATATDLAIVKPDVYSETVTVSLFY